MRLDKTPGDVFEQDKAVFRVEARNGDMAVRGRDARQRADMARLLKRYEIAADIPGADDRLPARQPVFEAL